MELSLNLSLLNWSSAIRHWSDFSLLSCVVLAIGLLGFVVAFLACCGAITNSRCLLGMFIIFLLALLVGEVTLAVLIYFKVSICNIVFLNFVRQPTLNFDR